MELGGWACGPPPTCTQQRMEGVVLEQQIDAFELQELQSRALRVLLGAPHLLMNGPQLRSLVLGGSRAADESERSRRALLELAIASLVEQGLVVRQGFGAFAALSVPDAALSKAEALAYSDFPDEGQLPLYSSAAAVLAGGAPHPCPPSRHRLRRHSSPRQFARMSGIEKAGSGRRSGKRGSLAEEMSSQLQKKMRMQDVGSSGGIPGGLAPAGSFAGSGGGGPLGSGAMAMSP